MISIISYLKSFSCFEKKIQHWITQQGLTCHKTNQPIKKEGKIVYEVGYCHNIDYS